MYTRFSTVNIQMVIFDIFQQKTQFSCLNIQYLLWKKYSERSEVCLGRRAWTAQDTPRFVNDAKVLSFFLSFFNSGISKCLY